MNRKTILPLALVWCAVFGLWAWAASMIHRPVLPGPIETLQVLEALVTEGVLAPHFAASAYRVLLAVVFALVPALILGLSAGLSPRADRVLSPVLYVLHPLPKVVFLPLFFLFLGLGDEPKIALMAFIIFSQLAVASRDGARRLPRGLREQMRSLGAGRRAMIVDVVIPGVLPEVFSALRIALGTSVAVLFFAESFASVSGLGWFIVDAWGRVDYPQMYAGIVALAILGGGLLVLVDFAEAVFCPWKKQT